MSDPPRYDLREEPWIPVRIADLTVSVGLRELFLRAHDIEDLALPVPPAASALLRVLTVIAARITALDDPDLYADDWLDARKAALLRRGGFDAAAVHAYFDRPDLVHRFGLFDRDRPFLQDPALSEQCSKRAGVNKLAFGRAAGNNPTWWGPFHDTEPQPLPADQAAWYLLVQHFYGPSGRCSARTVDGRTDANSTAGPLRKTISFHPLGRTLHESLLASVPRLTEGATGTTDLCPWEEPDAPDPRPTPTPLTWPGRLLTGRSRHALLLLPTADGRAVTDAYLTWGTRHPALAATDPYLVMNTVRTGPNAGNRYSREADPARALWRDLDALLLKSDATAGFHRPTIFQDLNDLPSDLRSALRVRAYGFEQDGQQVDTSWFTSVTPPLLRWTEEQDPAAARRISLCREAAEEVANKLGFAAAIAWAEATLPPPKEGSQVKADTRRPGPWRQRAWAEYWPQAETTFWALLQDTATEPYRAFTRVAGQALHAAVGTAEKEQKAARAVSHALGILRTVIPAATPARPGPKEAA
ncbi:type I-E CRISPR-associated protein Cse1/CasA [Streptacidiphilus cavernicola]|uniref:Type I-E CRISPR-associated protein Cse1/CasA n=1 Tax=Streptacidiphilus cavernicola TaxID=3342716 RepID=A0ABV6VVM2_9ACTN